MTRQDIEALLALAARATPGPWVHVPSTDMVTLLSDDDDVVVEANDDVATAAYLAACSPERIAALCRQALEADALALKVRLLERTAERNALCPDHRDKGIGDECIVCKFERSTASEARRQAFNEALLRVGKIFNVASDAYDELEATRDRAPEATR